MCTCHHNFWHCIHVINLAASNINSLAAYQTLVTSILANFMAASHYAAHFCISKDKKNRCNKLVWIFWFKFVVLFSYAAISFWYFAWGLFHGDSGAKFTSILWFCHPLEEGSEASSHPHLFLDDLQGNNRLYPSKFLKKIKIRLIFWENYYILILGP